MVVGLCFLFTKKFCRSCCKKFPGYVKTGSAFKVFATDKSNPSTTASSESSNCKQSLSIRSETEYRENDFEIQMISKNLHNQIFGSVCEGSGISKTIIEKHKKELEGHGINIKNSDAIPNVRLKIPHLSGKNIEEHFRLIATQQVDPYVKLLNTLTKIAHFPTPPEKWILREGWTQYNPRNGESTQVDFPAENGLVLDVEVCLSAGSAPTLATAASDQFWYSWVSPQMFKASRKKKAAEGYTLDELIPLGRKGPKLIVGHNVCFDRARIREQYILEDANARFMDTMSMHVCVSGVTSYQRAVMKSKKEHSSEDRAWINMASLNSLADVYKLYCNGEVMSKVQRNVFVNGSLSDIKEDFQNLMSYCANDVIVTQRVLKKLYPLFQERFPHPVTLAGMLELGSAYLPVNSNWLRFISESNLAYEDLNSETKYHLTKKANAACQLLISEKYKNNLWWWDEDWSLQELKMKKSVSKKEKLGSSKSKSNEKQTRHSELMDMKTAAPHYEKFKHLYDMRGLIPIRRPFLPGYPAWYRKLYRKSIKSNQFLFESSPDPIEIGTGMQIVPKILELCWRGFPLHYKKEYGWGYLSPFQSDAADCIINYTNIRKMLIDYISNRSSSAPEFSTTIINRKFEDAQCKSFDNYKKSEFECNSKDDDTCYFYKLPHKHGTEFRVGNPLSKDFINKFYENVLSSGNREDKCAERIIKIAHMLSYWRNNRERVIQQMVVWLPLDNNSNNNSRRENNIMHGAICPQVVVCGTLTRRAMEPTWMTASNSQSERIGSELRAMVQAPSRYKIIGADVDSQELWLASVLGDSYSCGIHGATPLGWMTLSGSKVHGTDMHSKTAKAVGISREHAKVLNYARIYGAGKNFAEKLLEQFNQSFTDKEAKTKANMMYSITKGKKIFEIRNHFRDQYMHRSYTAYEARKISSACGRAFDEMFYKSHWTGGMESAMFNRLEEIALKSQPVTPFLGARLSRPLEGHKGSETRFLPTRVNWVVQSGAVDFLHLMLVSMRWLMGPHIRLCLSFHDELRYIAKENIAYKVALAMHITNLLTRSFCSSRLGINDLPMAVAFFSSVEIDTVLRKDCNMDCKTPSNPHGLKIGYGIPNGESLDVYEAIRKCGEEFSQ